MDAMVLDAQQWAVENFGDCDFGDSRLTKRLILYAESCAVRPEDATPQQTQRWSQCKGAYRFMDNRKVGFESIVAAHCAKTRKQFREGVYLSICDTTQLSFSLKRKIDSLGPVGDNIGQGFLLHSSLIVREETEEIVGLAGQELFYRVPKPPGDTSAKRKKRKRESEVWGRIADQVGRPPQDVSLIHICDRGADDFEFYCHCVLAGAGWVVRAQQLTRKILPLDPTSPDAPQTKKKLSLRDHLAKHGTRVGEYKLKIRTNKKQKARTAKVVVRCARFWMPRPKFISPWAKTNGPKYIPMSVVEVVEVRPRRGVVPLRWVLLTHDTVETMDESLQVISRYEKRPIVEEYHKALKTGAAIEERLYRTNKRLERISGILCVLAVRIVQMKTIAKKSPNRLARQVAPRKWVTALCRIQRNQSPGQRSQWNPRTLTIGNFLRGLAMLGGFLARASDGNPGWITLWRGVKELQLALRGMRLGRSRN